MRWWTAPWTLEEKDRLPAREKATDFCLSSGLCSPFRDTDASAAICSSLALMAEVIMEPRREEGKKFPALEEVLESRCPFALVRALRSLRLMPAAVRPRLAKNDPEGIGIP